MRPSSLQNKFIMTGTCCKRNTPISVGYMVSLRFVPCPTCFLEATVTPIFSKGSISKFFSPNQTLGISIEMPYETSNVMQ